MPDDNPIAHRFALASEIDRLSPAARSSVTHIIIDDGEWSEEQITDYIANHLHHACESPTVELWQ